MNHAFIDAYADLSTPLHRMNTRLKIIAVFSFLLAVILSPVTNIPFFAFYIMLVAVLLFISRVPLGFIMARALRILPFIVIISLSALLREDGYTLFLNCLVKSLLAMLLALLLSSTTKFNELLLALKQLRLPAIFVSLLSFMYRYSFILEDEILRTKRAYEARNINNRNDFRRVRILSNILGTVFIHTYERAERVYLAMCARGYNAKEGN